MLRNAAPLRPFSARRLMTLFAVLILGTVLLCSGTVALAQTPLSSSQQNVTQVAGAAGLAGSNTDLITIIGRIINILLGFLGIVLLGLLLYSGFQWMTAGGDSKKVEEAKARIRNAIIGIFIIAAAWAITSFILGALAGVGGGGGVGGPGGGGPGGGFPTGAGSLGGGIIESHYPPRNAVDVPRNTAIIVTFKQPIKIASLIANYNDNGTPANLADDTVTTGMNDLAVKLYPTTGGVQGALTTSQVRVSFTADRRTFVFRPVQPLGSPSTNMGYTVELKGGLGGVLLEDGSLAFGGAFSNGYIWTFAVGTQIDVTPPRVESVIPAAGNQYAPNIVLQVIFNEAVDPTAATGLVGGGQGFQNIRTHAGGVATPPIDGQYVITNQYRTVEFTPAQACGRNSCGRDMFCLPLNAVIDAIVRAATLNGTGPAAQFLQSGYDGVVDVAGNSLDGNRDGTTQGQGADDYAWSFGTSDIVNRNAPVIESTNPPADPADPGQSNIDPFAPVTARFDSLLQSSTVNTSNAYILTKEPPQLDDTFWWQTAVRALTSANTPVVALTDIAAKGEVILSHRMYASSTEYDPYFLSGIQNAYQNCFNPASGPACPLGPGGQNCCQGTRQAANCQL
jgi:hypothetical protein